MRPTTPNFNFAQQTRPSSPPQTPTTSAFPFNANRRNGMHFSKPTLPARDGTITPNGNGPFHFSYTPSARPEDLSPRSSSSPASSAHSSSSGSPPRSLSSSPAVHATSSPPRRTKVVTEGNFTLEEFNESAYEEWESGDEDVIRPYQYEDADSETAQSVKSSGGRSKIDLDPKILEDFRDLDCGTQEEEHEAWVKAERARKKWKRRSSGTKRTLTQSIGSDTDDEDLQPVMFEGANKAGSSARRLRRKVGERTSLIFDDPPPRIEEGNEGYEEVVEDEDEIDRRTMRELPYFLDMEIDSDEE